jgi:hypothetical protein
MTKFNAGDYVVPIRADRPGCIQEMKMHIGKVLQVYDSTDTVGDLTIYAGKLGSKTKKWLWNPDDLRLATDEEIQKAKSRKPFRRGDVVRYDGDIWIVLGLGDEHLNEIIIASLTGELKIYHVLIDEGVVPIGSLRNKIKWMKNLT